MRALGEELRRRRRRGRSVCTLALAGTRMAAPRLAQARPGATLVEPGEEAEALAPLPIRVLEKMFPR